MTFDFVTELCLNSQAKTLFSIRREELIHWKEGYKVAALIILEKKPIVRRAKEAIKAIESKIDSERKKPYWVKKIMSIFTQTQLLDLEDLTDELNLLRMQTRDVEMELDTALSEINRFNETYINPLKDRLGIKPGDDLRLVYEAVQAISGEALANKLAEVASISLWSHEQQLPESVTRMFVDALALGEDRDRFYSAILNNVQMQDANFQQFVHAIANRTQLPILSSVE